MDTYRIAGVTVSMECSGETMKKQTTPYLIAPLQEGTLPDIAIDLDCEELKGRRLKYPHLTADEWEYVQSGFAFYRDILDYGGFGLHSSALAWEGQAVLFSGPCGAGKSTHAGLWQQAFGKDRAIIINDDKPVVRLDHGMFFACGTPWSGKSALNTNIRVPVGAIVFLEKARMNCIRSLGSKEAVRLLIYQSLRPSSHEDKMAKLLTLIDALLPQVPIYRLECNVGMEAVELVKATIESERMKRL